MGAAGFFSDGHKFHKLEHPDAEFTDLFDISDENIMVGGFTIKGEYKPFIYNAADASYTWLGESYNYGTIVALLGINNKGHMVGSYRDRRGILRGFFYDGSFTTIDSPDSISTEAMGINDFDQVVGYYADKNKTNHGFIFDKITGEFTSVDIPKAAGTTIYDINNKGILVGGFTDKNGLTLGFIGSLECEPEYTLCESQSRPQ